jgi:hypothetical protein
LCDCALRTAKGNRLIRADANTLFCGRSLTVYRMVFGQNKQDDLVEFLLKSLSPEQIAKIAQVITINLEPPR